MMVIKKFAKLCGCNPQTLRYYDSIDLLKPVNVDYFTGYRYYNASQALDYLKIKKLQDAYFSIEEIKKLLTCDDEKIYDALQQKIEEQKAKLLELKNIQKSYHKDMKEMKEKVNEIKEKIMKTSNELDYKDEFGIDESEFYEIIEATNTLLDNALSEDTFIFEQGKDEESKYIPSINNKLVYEYNNYEKLKDVFENLPEFKKGKYIAHITVNEKFKNNSAFINVLTYKTYKHLGNKSVLELRFEISEDQTQNFRIYKVSKTSK